MVRNRGSDWRDPRDLTVDAGNARKVWVLDTGNDRVVRLDTVHGDQEKVFALGSVPTLTEAYGLTDTRNWLYVADTYNHRIRSVGGTIRVL